MILDVFPSYKDKDIVDLLYQYERATGLSLNILVEKYLEKLLYDNDYFTDKSENVSESKEIIEDKRKTKLSKTKQGKFSKKKQKGKIRLVFEKYYDFGVHNPEEVDELISNLLDNFSDDELRMLSKNEWQYHPSEYIPFLQAKAKSPEMSLIDFLKQQEKLKFIYLNQGKYIVQKGIDGYDYVYGRGYTLEEANIIVIFLVLKDWDKKYSTRQSGKIGVEQRAWLLTEVENEMPELLEDN